MVPSSPLTVALSFDFDAQLAWAPSAHPEDLSVVSRGEFGAFALPRVLSLLRRREIRATFFVPGGTAVVYPDLVRAIVADGHEVGHHGWMHERTPGLDAAAQREAFERGLEALDQVAGVRPSGYRAPAAALSSTTLSLLREGGLTYDSSCSASDYRPYYLREGDAFGPDVPYSFGRSVDVVEMPFSWALDDFPYVEVIPGRSLQQSPPSTLREVWLAEFDYARREHRGGVYVLCMHPQTIGRGRHLDLLEQVLIYMEESGAARFERLGDFAARWRELNPLEDWRQGDSVHAR